MIPHSLDDHDAIDILLMAYRMIIWHPTIWGLQNLGSSPTEAG
jgi:hypothetical protein